MWTVMMIVVAVVVNLAMIYLRNLRAFAAIGIWALIGIAVKHWDSVPTLQWTAMIGAGILLGAIFISILKNRKKGLSF